MGLRETDLDDIFNNSPRDYPTNDVVGGVLTLWDGGIHQVHDQENLGDENYYTEDSIKTYGELITYVLHHLSGKKSKKIGSNYRGSAESMSYPQVVTTSDEKIRYLLLQYIWLLWEKTSWECIRQEGNNHNVTSRR